MQYIILDMEWNQPWPGSYSAKKALPSPLRGEIGEVRAVGRAPGPPGGARVQVRQPAQNIY